MVDSGWFGAICILVGCFWIGAALGAGIAAVLGFYGGFMWATLMGRRNATAVIDQMIRDETANVAERARRTDVEMAVSEANRIGEAASLVLEAMTGRKA